MDDLGFNITIVGLGLMGGSFAMALRELNPKNLWAVDVDEHALKLAEGMRIIDKGYTEAEIPLRESEIVIIALYPNITSGFVKRHIKDFRHGAIITDIGGIKEELVTEISSFIPENLDFIGGHPMAGREKQGIEYASKEIFLGSSYIFTPTGKNREENIRLLESIAKDIGCGSTVRISPKQHDEIIAFTSHLPHILAVALINSCLTDLEISMFSGRSFKDGTRVAEINSSLWVELLHSNRGNIINMLETFEENLKVIKNAIMEGNSDLIKSEFDRAGLRRKELG